jgi:hypothetical protein
VDALLAALPPWLPPRQPTKGLARGNVPELFVEELELLMQRKEQFVPRACQALTSFLTRQATVTAATLDREWGRVARRLSDEVATFEDDLLSKRCVLEVVRIVLARR